MQPNPHSDPDRSNNLDRLLLGDNLAQRFFGGLVECVFQQELGIVNPAVTDYAVNLCLRSLRPEGFGWPIFLLNEISAPPVRLPVSDVAELRQVLDHVPYTSDSEFVDLLVCTGDAALITVGLFQKSLRKQSSDQLVELHDLGKRTYLKAATLNAKDPDKDLSALYFFSDNFEKAAYGLRKVSEAAQAL